jgi:RNA polymerase sigma-70 factor (ECF subfamily)
MTTDFEGSLEAHRAALLRHCYRMLASLDEAEDAVQESLVRAWKARATYRGEAPFERWLYAISTRVCLDALRHRRRRGLPQLDGLPAGDEFTLVETDPSVWIEPAPDARLFPDGEVATDRRESIALAFVALLQELPPKQRAVLILKDVLGWPAEDIATALGLSLSSVNSALHRARAIPTRADRPHAEPAPERLAAFVRAWEERDLDALVELLQEDVVLAMPPYAVWLRGPRAVARLFGSPRFVAFWSSVQRIVPVRANGLPAFVFHRALADGEIVPHAVLVARFVAGSVAEMTAFIGPSFVRAFDRTVPMGRVVMTIEGGLP